MSELVGKVNEAVKCIRKKVKTKPSVAIILGTGLSKVGKDIKSNTTMHYADIPNFPLSTVESHKGRLIFGTLSGRKIVAMQGRFHFYEGYSLQEVVYPVRVFKALGAHTLIVSNACGGINPAFRPGDIMLITDHINLLGHTPLCGKNDSRLGPRFPDMYNAYNDKLLALAGSVAKTAGISVQKGVYAIMSGPCLETAAEYRMLGRLGADAVGMSTVPEVIAAVHAGLKVLGISVITDKCDPDTLKPVNIDEIIATASRAEPQMVKIIEGVLKKLPR